MNADATKCHGCLGESEFVACETCGGEGVYGHDCGEDSCCCYPQEENVPCSICDGEGGWWMCVNRCGRAKEGTAGT